MTLATLRIATDVGGTFTDLVALRAEPNGRQTIISVKVASTPPDFEIGVLAAMAEARVTLADIDVFTHGTTVIINALTERKGAVTALVTTTGFCDVLEIARGNRPDFFNLLYAKPEPFVPRRLRHEVAGRISYRGEELAPLDLSTLPASLDQFRREGVTAVAVCLLHAYANPEHERKVAAEIRRLWPECSVVASHQITREWREYERTSTTVLSAYVQPVAEAYLTRLEAAMVAAGFAGRRYVMQSNCGVNTFEATRKIPITMIESGPASGFWGAARLGRVIGEPNILAIDIGGTTAKCALIRNGEVTVKTDYWIERDRRSAGYPVMVPVVDLVEIGNGGGSIAAVDRFGKLHVGPRSAGAVPGPAACGRGSEPTTTDANLALGRLDPSLFAGGADMNAAGRALDTVALPLGLDRDGAARAIIRIADDNMVNALKLVSLNRGHDPREFTLVAFGGGGPLHAASLAAELGIRKVVVPRGAAVFSAWGMLMSHLRRDYFSTRLLADSPAAAGELDAAIAEVMAQARAEFAAEAVDEVAVQVFAKCRYQNQEHAVEVPVIERPADLAALVERFQAAYQLEYTYRLDTPLEIVGLHVVAIAEFGHLEMAESAVPVAAPTPARWRRIDFATRGCHPAQIHQLDRIDSTTTMTGPAVIEDAGTSIIVHPGDRATVDSFGNVHIAIGGLDAFD